MSPKKELRLRLTLVPDPAAAAAGTMMQEWLDLHRAALEAALERLAAGDLPDDAVVVWGGPRLVRQPDATGLTFAVRINDCLRVMSAADVQPGQWQARLGDLRAARKGT